MKVIYETTYDDGEYPDQLDYECQDDPCSKGVCVSTKLFAFTKEELDALWDVAQEAAGDEEPLIKSLDEYLKSLEAK